MSKRILRLIGGLLAVGALAVVPTAATADASSTAKASGGGSGCQDNWDPQSRWGNGNWYGDNNNWGGWGDGNGYFGGQSWDQGCNGNSSTATAARVSRVMVSVQRLRGSQCQNLSGSGSLGRPTDCSNTRPLQATGTRHWHQRIANPLPRGAYRLQHRAIDGAGNRGKLHVLRMRIR